jgi:hypothetical protein
VTAAHQGIAAATRAADQARADTRAELAAVTEERDAAVRTTRHLSGHLRNIP